MHKGSDKAHGAALGLSAVGSVPDPDVGLPGTDLVGARTVRRSSFHIWKTSETQLHSLSLVCSSLELFPTYLNYPLNPGLVSCGFFFF